MPWGCCWRERHECISRLRTFMAKTVIDVPASAREGTEEATDVDDNHNIYESAFTNVNKFETHHFKVAGADETRQ